MATQIDDFTAGFSEAQNRAIALDNAILGNASNISTQYTDLVSLAVRQTLGSLDFTVSTGTDGKPNASDVRIFMKDISSPTPTGRVNPVEKMYGALPLLLYLNASIVGPLLAPLLDAQDSTMGQPSAAQDLGPAYPNATGATWGANLDVEQSGNMLIMLYAHARFSGDGTLIHKHYNLAKRWTDYLVNNTLSPSSVQVTADSETGSIYNMTNLALKGIIGVQSMAEMSRALGEQADAQLYDHPTSASPSIAPPAQPTLVCVHRARGKQTMRTDSVSSAWILFTAAIVTDDSVRDSLIRDVWNRASFNQTQGPFPESYDTKTGGNQSGGSPTSSGGQGASDDGHKASVGAIVGGVVGGTAVALLFCATVYLVRRKIFRRGMEDRHRPSLPSLFPETHLSTNDLDISGPLTSPPAFSPGGGAVTLATKSGGPPLPAEPYLSPSSAGRMRMPSTIWTARGAPPSSVWPASRNSSSGYTNEVAGLRVEIENLRQAMQVMNTAAERGADAPPEYVG
ncbi:hypothetical protein TRAPUB_10957 [Trametes pubescens]|uniref:Glutaminase A central domain-containing protein n=1 Tax=Trametes pubescens TaxID=154538 RepID=A0A1M2VY65_TRAPU|nr:hypothetical protein TRAPUB_10957 [Trametes pubescens]